MFKPRRYEEIHQYAKRLKVIEAGLNLYGPMVPFLFAGNGCSVPIIPTKWANGRWGHACRIHDYEYHILRMEKPGSDVWKNRRYQADLNLKMNIELIGRAQIKNWFRRRVFVQISRVYFLGVRLGGRRPATGTEWRREKWYRKLLSPIRRRDV
jgi:hypothetical protein